MSPMSSVTRRRVRPAYEKVRAEMSVLSKGMLLVQAVSPGDELTVNALAGRLDTDPRLARVVLYEAHNQRLVEPTADFVSWVRLESDESDLA
jgi:hypothetical protein